MCLRKLLEEVEGMPSPTVGDIINYLRTKANEEEPEYTIGHCENHKQPGGCQLHNLFCQYPECDRKRVKND